MVLVPRTYHCSCSPSLCCCPFGATNMSATTAPLYGPAMIAERSTILFRLSGAANLLDARVGHLLVQCSVSSPHCKAQWEQATVEDGVRAAEDAYAELLITPLGAIELVVALKAPKSGFRALSEFFTWQGLQYSLKTGRPFLRPVCTRGDAIPCAGEARATCASRWPTTRDPAYHWVIGMAVCGDKDMAQLGAIWRDNLQVTYRCNIPFANSLCYPVVQI